ncbi:hypothetical protein COCON_G00146950 [Conger conger]|uniref:Telomere zinc finger-associated protein n=1 Tax=Conger conger TaxID=82655 RepID=A0A9Q1HW96_CONCO|nr:hypothetical protein COCON_G00146950 [Conger conger]
MAVPQAHAQRMLSFLNQQRGLGRFCDAMLSLGSGQVYLAHRNVLACFSELFQETYTTTTTCMEVCLPEECPTDGLELVLDFVYTGELKLDSVNLEKVRRAAVSLSVPDAVKLCQNFTSQQSLDQRPKTEELGTGDEGYRGLDTPSVPQGTSSTETPVKGKQKPRPTAKPRVKAYSAIPKRTASILPPTTTTRSGRTVKGPSRLLREGSPTPPLTPRGGTARKADPGVQEAVKGGAEEGSQSGDRPASEPEVAGDSELANENEDEDYGEVDGPQEDTDEEYLPRSLPVATGGPQRTKRRGRGKAVNKENGEGAVRDSKRNSVQCPTCHKTFLSKYYLKVHNRRHTGEKPFECSKCGKCYYRKENLLEHEARNCLNRAGVVFSCSMCPMTFRKRLELRVHTVTHTGEMPNKCTSCPEQFMQKKDLKIHLIKVHGAPKPHACPLCPKCFLSRTELRLHEASKHRGEKLFVCEECGHRASSRNGLQMHIKAIHRNERPFVCEFCNHAFTQKANLNMHLRTHTGEKPFQCHLCGKTFRTQASLDKHHRTHTGERPFRCEFCDQRFTEKGPLLRHVASKHQEGRPHYCHICSKTFKAIEQLRVHVRRHKGMRKFECVECGYKFTRQAHLRRHSQIHNRVENYNPRQRRLRNLVVEDEKAAEGAGPAGGDVIGVMIQPSTVVVEEVVSTQGAGPSEAGEEGEGEGEAEGEQEGEREEEEEGPAFTVADVMEQTLLVTGAYPTDNDTTAEDQEMVEGGDEEKA